MKIYVSGTYHDLQEYRLAVASALRRMGHQPIGMEDYVAEGIRPMQRCMADVEACDVYVGIIAWRYGYIPRVEAEADVSLEIAGAQLGKTSITEFEYRKAIMCKKPILMFLLDSKAQWSSLQFDALSGDETHGEAISRLRREITQNHMVDFFRTPDELASLVSTSIYREEMNSYMKFKQLNIDAQLNEPFVRQGEMMDSTVISIKHVMVGPSEFQALKIDIGQGSDWWMSRLYFLSSLVADLTTIEVVVFVGNGENNTQDTFIGITHPRIVKERLAYEYEAISQYESALKEGARSENLNGEVDRRVAVWNASMGGANGEAQNAVPVTRRELKRILNPYLIVHPLIIGKTENTAFQMQRILDWPMRFVPVVEDDQLQRIVDKQSLSDQLARLFIRDQVARAISTSV